LPLLLAVLSLVIARDIPGQAVPRMDTPRGGTLRVTFEPIITTWEHEFTGEGKHRIGASLFSEGPSVFRCVRIPLSDTTSHLACRYSDPVFVRTERRETALIAEFGLTNRLAVSARLALVRTNVQARHDSTALDSLLAHSTYAFAPIENTRRHLRYFPGDFEVGAKHRLFVAANAATTVGFVARLPTGHQDSPHDLFDVATGDHQTDLEIQATQELIVARRLWFNAAVRAGTQLVGARERRVGPHTRLLIPYAATARLNWRPGNYAAIDVAPMYRFHPNFGFGVSAGYWTKQRDRYSYRSPQDSIDVATRLGSPVAAGVLDAGTSQRWLRLGVVMTYAVPEVEGSFSLERTVTGSGGRVPAATVFRVVMRTSRWPF
jgi:hypothetical protein